MKRTSGPWKVSRVDSAFAYVSGPHGHIATVTLNGDFVEHDARLIAAAPDLYDALEQALPVVLKSGDSTLARAIIETLSKAKGEL